MQRSPTSGLRSPRVSIVIPTLGNPLIQRCLHSLRQNVTTAIAHEIVVVANGPTAAHLASAVTLFSSPVRLLPSVANLGFGGRCNRWRLFVVRRVSGFVERRHRGASRMARGVGGGTANRHPDAGAVGQFDPLCPDGAIQEAGSIAWRDEFLCCSLGAATRSRPIPTTFLRPVTTAPPVRCWCAERRGRQSADRRELFSCLLRRCRPLFRSRAHGLANSIPAALAGHYVMKAPAAPRPASLMLRHRETFRHKWGRELAECEPAAPTTRGR